MPETTDLFTAETELLKKIDLTRERAGVSYRQAKEALEKNGGDLLKTLIDLEEETKQTPTPPKINWTENLCACCSKAFHKTKKTISQINENKIRIKYDNKILADIPILLGVIGGIIVPQLVVLGIILAMFKKVAIEIGHAEVAEV
jgi:hypothetical protein